MIEKLQQWQTIRRNRAEARAWADLAARMAWRDCGLAEPLWRYRLKRWAAGLHPVVGVIAWTLAAMVGGVAGAALVWLLYVLAAAL